MLIIEANTRAEASPMNAFGRLVLQDQEKQKSSTA
jgi:hypothetical protein